MVSTPPMLALSDPHPGYRWFSSYGCVVERGDRREVYAGGTLIGAFGPKERGMRNAILMGLCTDPRTPFARLAPAFGLTEEGLRLMRRQYERDGLAAVVARTVGGSESKVTPRLRAKLEECFESGMSVSKGTPRRGGR